MGSATDDSRWAASVVVADPTTRESEGDEDFSRVVGITNSGRAALPTAHPQDGVDDDHRGVHHYRVKPPERKGAPPPSNANNNEENRPPPVAAPPPPLLPLPSVASWREEPATMNVEATFGNSGASLSGTRLHSNHSNTTIHNAIPLEEESSLLRDSAVVLLPVASSDSISALHNDNDHHRKQEKSSAVAAPPVESTRSKRRARANSTLSSVAAPSVSFFNTVVVLHSHSSGSSSSSDKDSSCEETDDDENHSDHIISAAPSQHHSAVIPAPKTSLAESGFTIAIIQPTEEYHESGRGVVVSRRRSSLGDDDDEEYRHSHPIPTDAFLTAAVGGGGNSPNLHYNNDDMGIPSPHDAAIEEDRIGLDDDHRSDEEDDEDDDEGGGDDGRMTPPGLMYVVSIPPPMRSSLSVPSGGLTQGVAGGDGGGAIEDAFGSPTGFFGGADISPPATSSSEHSDDKPLRGSALRRGGSGRGSASRGRHQGDGNSSSGSRSAAPRSPFSSVISRMPPSFAQQQQYQGQLQGQLNDWARSSHSGVLLSPPEATSLSNLAGPPPLNLPMLLDGSEPAPSTRMPVVPTLPVFIGSTTTNGPPVPPRQRRRQQVAALGSSGFTTKSTTATTSSSSTKDSDEYLELEISSQRLLHANHPRSSSSGGAAVSEGSMSLSIRSTAYVELEPLTAGSVSPRDQLAVLRQRSYQRNVPGFHARGGGGMNSAGPLSAAPQMFVVPGTPHHSSQTLGGATWAPPSPRSRRNSRRSSTSGGKNPLPLIAGDDHEFDSSPLPPLSSREGSRHSEHSDQ